ncbi:MAG TPA: hypothetical protein VL125_11220 [Pelobium sp.]|nr:hypothetical protein [Pelobium sp.]
MRFFYTLVLICFTYYASAQTIRFQQSFESAKLKAVKEKKPIALIFNPTTLSPKMNALNSSVLTNASVVEVFNKDFINVKFYNDSDGSKKLIAKYHLSKTPTVVFLDYNADILLKVDLTGNSITILKQAELANAYAKQGTLAYFKKEYSKGNRNKEFLRKYLIKLNNIKLLDNTQILEDFVNSLQVSDLNDYQTVLTILKSGPILDSKNYKLAYLNESVVDSIYKTENNDIRVAMNLLIRNKSLQVAIKNKDIGLLSNINNFEHKRYGKDYQEANKIVQFNYISYYSGIKDTLKYFQAASNFFKRYYLSINQDSCKKLDSIFTLKMKEKTLAKLKEATEQGEKNSSYSTFYTMPSGNMAKMLLVHASRFAGYKLKDKPKLYELLDWTGKSYEFYPQPGALNTMAILLYQLGFYTEAEVKVQEAITLAKSKNMGSFKFYEDTLDKIKTRTL